MLKRYLLPLFLATALVLCLGQAAFAETQETEYEFIAYSTQNSDAVMKVQEQLIRLFYLSEADDFTRGTFDSATNQALSDFCRDKHVEHMMVDENGNQGITPRLQKFLLEGSPSPKATQTPVPPTPTPSPTATPFPNFRLGQQGEAVANVQDALYRLGYFDEVQHSYKPGVFDEATEEAVKAFCEVIHAAYSQEEGLTSYLYNRITADNAPARPQPTEPASRMIEYDSRGDDVRAAQQKLKELDYFRDLGEPEWGHYDSVTSQAVVLFCEVNGLAVNQYGMDEAFLDRLESGDALKNPEERRDITKGDQGDMVKKLQARLSELNYYDNRLRTNACDQDMLDAVADFARVNHISHEDKNVVTVDMQDAILAENAKPYEKEESKGLAGFLTGTAGFLGMDMPMYLVILIGALILGALAFALVKVFGGKKEAEKENSHDSWNEEREGGNPQIELEISYRGAEQTVPVTMDRPLRIGRAENTLPLNANDTDISRRHCQMYFRGKTLILRDYSSNGTQVDGESYHNCECVVRDGATVQIGNHRMRIRILK